MKCKSHDINKPMICMACDKDINKEIRADAENKLLDELEDKLPQMLWSGNSGYMKIINWIEEKRKCDGSVKNEDY